MPSFSGLSSYKTPFGKNQYLWSTRGTKFKSFTLAKSTVPARSIDGVSTKLIHAGVVLAQITSGPEAGKVGPYQPGTVVTESVLVTISGANGGTFTLTFDGEETENIDYDASAEEVQAALNALAKFEPGDVICTGGPLDSDPVVITFGGSLVGRDLPDISIDGGDLTGEGAGGTVTVTDGAESGGLAAADDGRENPKNIVGILDTELPWQLNERDVEVAVLYDGDVRQEWCLELKADGTDFVALTDATAERLRGGKTLDIRCH